MREGSEAPRGRFGQERNAGHDPLGMDIHRCTREKIATLVPLFVAMGILLPLGGCSLFGKKKPDVPEATLPAWVGRIVMVDAGNRFALVDTGAPAHLAPGTKLLSFRDQRRTAFLAATAESRPPFLAVDITDGLPSTGDQVALYESIPPRGAPPE